MNKKTIAFLALLFVCLTLFCAAPSKAIVLPVPVVGQNTPVWCSFAATQAIENFLGNYRYQYLDVDWVQQTRIAAGTNWIHLWTAPYVECYQFAVSHDSPPAYPDPAWKCGAANGMIGTGGTADVMSQLYGTTTEWVPAPLSTATDVQTEINAGHPLQMGVGSYGSQFHRIVAYGVSGPGATLSYDATMAGSPDWNNTYVHVMDPDGAGPTTGAHFLYLGSEFFAPSHDYPQWFETLKTTKNVYPPVPAIKVNGYTRSGTIYWNHTSSISVAANLSTGGFGGTQADWWVAALYHGTLYYYNASTGGWYTSAVPTWQKPVANTTSTFWTAPIPQGDQITFYWVLDLARNGVLDGPAYSTYLTIIGN